MWLPPASPDNLPSPPANNAGVGIILVFVSTKNSTLWQKVPEEKNSVKEYPTLLQVAFLWKIRLPQFGCLMQGSKRVENLEKS